MKTIKNLPQNQKRHYAKCPVCQHYFNMRDLSDVLLHDHYLQRIPMLPLAHSLRKETPIIYYRAEEAIILN